jgi:hypothetical protein
MHVTIEPLGLEVTKQNFLFLTHLSHPRHFKARMFSQLHHQSSTQAVEYPSRAEYWSTWVILPTRPMLCTVAAPTIEHANYCTSTYLCPE